MLMEIVHYNSDPDELDDLDLMRATRRAGKNVLVCLQALEN